MLLESLKETDTTVAGAQAQEGAEQAERAAGWERVEKN
jgi:hypothetical protein